MESLWLAIAIYSVGLALVIWMRPALMFNENGSWKEFGYQRTSRHTLFPVWLFAITWAFVSYALAAALIWILTGRSVAAAMSASAAAASAVSQSQNRWTPSRGLYEPEDEEDEEESDDEFAIPVSRVPRSASRSKAKAKPRAGYYVLDPESERSGLHRYIYYGDKPPQEA
jgi:hypothetical protein